MSVTVTKEQINELRTTFLNELDANTNFEIHPSDLDRIKCSDDWLRRFLQHQRCNQKNALGMLWDTVKWRKEHGVNDINESNVRIDYLEEGSIFAHGRDKDGCILFIFKCKKHIKGSKNMDELQRCIIYWFERIEK